MMTVQNLGTIKKRAAGDSAIDGLLAGLGAGLVMGLFLLLVGLVGYGLKKLSRAR